jgi:hypothetical protein
MRVVVCAVVLAACSFKHGGLQGSGDAPPVDDDAAPENDATPIDARPIDGPPDAPPDARVCPAAPAGCTRFTCATTSSCYYICSTTKRSWTSANTACASITSSGSTGCLATINDQAEQNCIVTATNPMFANNNFVWFGFRQDANPTEPAGDWNWQCGASTFVAGTGEWASRTMVAATRIAQR